MHLPVTAGECHVLTDLIVCFEWESKKEYRVKTLAELLFLHIGSIKMRGSMTHGECIVLGGVVLCYHHNIYCYKGETGIRKK